jgi:hypothetical protein
MAYRFRLDYERALLGIPENNFGSDGSFHDTPNGSCYGTSQHFCAVANPQSFRLTNGGTVFPIATMLRGELAQTAFN